MTHSRGCRGDGLELCTLNFRRHNHNSRIHCLQYTSTQIRSQEWRTGKSVDWCRIDRGYDFTGVLEWFAERVDRIILLFDAHKLDISDEFKRCIEALSG